MSTVPATMKSVPTVTPASEEDDWQLDVTRAAVLYRMIECGDTFDLVDTEMGQHGVFLKPIIDQMYNDSVIKIDGDQKWVPTKRGKKLLAKLVQMTDITARFSIFQSFVFEALADDKKHENRPGQVRASEFDPRFREDPNAEDLRLAMFSFLNDSGKLEGAIDLRRVVFLQHLGSGKFRSDGKGFWADLRFGVLFAEVEKIVENAYKWRDIDPDNEENAKVLMTRLYEAGMTELQKRAGITCGGCDIPLALFDAAAADAGKVLTDCPGCNRHFPQPGDDVAQQAAPVVTTYGCPNCNAEIRPSDRFCPGCASEIDHSMVTGTVATTTTPITTTETVVVGGWGYCYDYVPYQPFYAYDPFYDALAFACLVDPFYYW